MNITLQYVIIALLIVIAIIYFIRRKVDKENINCDEKCTQCDLYKHCKSKK